MRASRSRGLLAVVPAIALLALLAGTAGAKQPDYQGTYTGVVTTKSGRVVPVTAFISDAGDEAVFTVTAEGYTVRIDAAEMWQGETGVGFAPVVPAQYASVLEGSGEVILAREGDEWNATGSGSGTALATHVGSAEGSARRVSPELDVAEAEEWHRANPVEGADAPAENPATIATIEGIAAPLVPRGQAPLPDPERIVATALVSLAALLLLINAFALGGRLPAAAASLGGGSR